MLLMGNPVPVSVEYQLAKCGVLAHVTEALPQDAVPASLIYPPPFGMGLGQLYWKLTSV